MRADQSSSKIDTLALPPFVFGIEVVKPRVQAEKAQPFAGNWIGDGAEEDIEEAMRGWFRGIDDDVQGVVEESAEVRPKLMPLLELFSLKSGVSAPNQVSRTQHRHFRAGERVARRKGEHS